VSWDRSRAARSAASRPRKALAQCAIFATSSALFFLICQHEIHFATAKHGGLSSAWQGIATKACLLFALSLSSLADIIDDQASSMELCFGFQKFRSCHIYSASACVYVQQTVRCLLLPSRTLFPLLVIRSTMHPSILLFWFPTGF